MSYETLLSEVMTTKKVVFHVNKLSQVAMNSNRRLVRCRRTNGRSHAEGGALTERWRLNNPFVNIFIRDVKIQKNQPS